MSGWNLDIINWDDFQKDKVDIQKALDMGVDWIALSFVQTEKDVEALKKIVGNKSLIMAKIEKPSALKNLDSNSIFSIL